jgi:hypothetical protein
MSEYLPSIDEALSKLLHSQFIPCLVRTLSRLASRGLPKKFPPDLSRSFVACVAELNAHGELRFLLSSKAISDLQQRTRATRWWKLDSSLPCLTNYGMKLLLALLNS